MSQDKKQNAAIAAQEQAKIKKISLGKAIDGDSLTMRAFHCYDRIFQLAIKKLDAGKKSFVMPLIATTPHAGAVGTIGSIGMNELRQCFWFFNQKFTERAGKDYPNLNWIWELVDEDKEALTDKKTGELSFSHFVRIRAIDSGEFLEKYEFAEKILQKDKIRESSAKRGKKAAEKAEPVDNVTPAEAQAAIDKEIDKENRLVRVVADIESLASTYGQFTPEQLAKFSGALMALLENKIV